MELTPIQSILGDAVFFGGFALIVLAMLGLVVYITRLEHAKEMALIEAGEYQQLRNDRRAWVLGGGLVLVALGLADVTTTFLAGGVPQEGVAATFVGLAALAYYFYKRREDREDDATTTARA
ncbi:hypothetical protein [Halogeometricum limi]|uniref:Uncharacterized protein n=1 Tax=Halogeometricum limi TaxID=555875 RepID=A0A1I6I1C2_9EURY|nr:hypothetical protein [Halogeometricum limi]SFR60511.1 hypothetical protein SAMN04488124_2695 [Halogeometricum limi]